MVRSCLAPGGRVFYIDNRDDPYPTSPSSDPYVVRYGPDLHLRRLPDGSGYRVVKVMYEPDELRSLLGQHGWEARVEGTRWFIYGEAEPTAFLG